MSLQIKTNANKVADKLKDLAKHLRKEGIDKSADKFLPKDVQSIKTKLKSIVREAVIPKPQEGDIPVELHDQPKAKNQMIKEIFGYDIADNHFKGKFHSSLDDKVMMLYKDSNKDIDHKNAGASRGRLKIKTEQYGSYDEQLSAARSYFNNAVFVTQESGEQKVYMNTGNVDMTDCVKVVCSEVGSSNPEHETPSRARFDRASGDGTGEVEWTLFQDCVDSKIKNQDGFTEITDMLDDMVGGDYEEAKHKLSSGRESQKTDDLASKIDDIAENTDVEPATEAITKVTESINKIKITKEIKKEHTQYKITGDLGQVGEAVAKTINIALAETKVWAEMSKALWTEKVGNEISKVIKDYWK